MSIDCSHGSFIERPNRADHGDCPDCRLARFEALLERIADAAAPVPSTRLRRATIADEFRFSMIWLGIVLLCACLAAGIALVLRG